MAKRSPETTIPDRTPSHRTMRLRRASDQLEAVLQSLDLEDETRLADEVAEAIRATDRAYELESHEEDAAKSSDDFIFPLLQAEGRSSRTR